VSKNIYSPNNEEEFLNFDLKKCIAESKEPTECAIDEIEGIYQDLAVRAGKSIADPTQIRLLVLGAISSCEHYFRRILSEIVTLCPLSNNICKKDLSINYYNASYYKNFSISSALLDNSIFSSAENIISETKKFTGISVKDSSSVEAALKEYHKVCILRHAIVHSLGNLGGKNLYDLKLERTNKSMVALTYESLSEILAVCLNAIRAYNLFMWRALLTRLKNDKSITPSGSKIDANTFEHIKNIFWTKRKLSEYSEGELYELFHQVNQ
jgi:hypothetical protein